MLAGFVLDRPMLVEETAGNETLALDDEYATRGGAPAGTDFAAAAVVPPGGATNTAARLLSAAFRS